MTELMLMQKRALVQAFQVLPATGLRRSRECRRIKSFVLVSIKTAYLEISNQAIDKSRLVIR
jgi:hypothetical protein